MIPTLCASPETRATGRIRNLYYLSPPHLFAPLLSPHPSDEVAANEWRGEGGYTIGNFFAPSAMPPGTLRPVLKLTIVKFNSSFRKKMMMYDVV